MTNREYMIWLSTVKISPSKKKSLLDCFGQVRDIYCATKKEIDNSGILSSKESEILIQSQKEKNVQETEETMKKKGISFCSLGDREYPALLTQIYDPPVGLYYKGRLPDGSVWSDNPTRSNSSTLSIAVVGARACSNYGKEFSYCFGKVLAANGVQVISGMARGIDSFSHGGAIHAKGSTFAVLGSGVDIVYPPENQRLYREIISVGGILSEYPPGTPPLGIHFPMRNRLISGLSHGVIVVEARKKSGSLITADMALEQGRDVFAVPGRAGDPLSFGTNSLIQQGAVLVDKPKDILEYYQVAKREGKGEKNGKKDLLLASEEKMVYSKLRLQEKHLNRLIEETGMGTGSLMEILLSLEAKKLIGHKGQYFYLLLTGNGEYNGC